MKKLYNLILLIVSLAISQSAFAQNVLTGIVMDKTFNEPLIGANVFLVNASNRTLSGNVADARGEYRLTIPAGQKDLSVVFSFIGYRTVIVKYTGQKTINCNMEDDSKTIQEVIVSEKRIERDRTGLTNKQVVASTQKVTFERLESAPVTNITEALQGAMANVDIVTSGDPGGKSAIRIRGTSSLNANNEPLIVLDGVPFPVEIPSDFSFAAADVEDYSNMLNISPSDVESIEALKDAAATAIWGSRGANGVLLITTKRGEKGRIQTKITTKFELRQEANTIPLLDASQYISLMQDGLWNSIRDVGYQSSEGQTYMDYLFNRPEIGFDPNYRYFNEYNQNVNWLDEVTRTAYSNDNSLSISGGGEKTDYMLSLTYLNETGTTIGTAYNRFNTMFKLGYRFSNNFDIRATYNFSYGDKDANWSMSGLGSPRGEAMTKMPNKSPYYINPDGSRSNVYFTPSEDFEGFFDPDNNLGRGKKTTYNPVASVYEAINNTKSYSNRVVLDAHYKFFQGLDFYGVYSITNSSNRSRSYVPSSVTGVDEDSKYNNFSTDGLSDRLYITTESRLNFVKQFNQNHQLVATASFNTADQRDGSYSSNVASAPSSSLIDPTAGGAIMGMKSSTSIIRSIGVVANAHYTLFKRYMFNLGYRNEANSALGAKERWKGFYTAAFAWQLGDEQFIRDLGFINLAKLRVSYGNSGNAPSGVANYFGAFTSSGMYLDYSAIQPVRVQLDNVKYEMVTTANAGLDVEIYNGMFAMAVDVYSKLTTDMLHKDVKIPTTTGMTEVKYYNSGSVSNQGWEFRLDYNWRQNKDWSLNVSVNLSQNFNRILALPLNKLEGSYTFGNGNYAQRVVIGDPLGAVYGYKSLGVYKDLADTYMKDNKGNVVYDLQGKPVFMTVNGTRIYPGDAKYADINGDGNIDQYDISYLGDANPRLMGGFNFMLRYKAFTLSGNFQGRVGQMAINNARMNLESMRGVDNQSVATLRRWRNEGDVTDIPRALFGRGFNYLGSDRFVEDASFLRMKSLSLRYRLPSTLTKAMGLSNLDAYITGYDLLTLTKYTGQDPEISNSSGSLYGLPLDKASTPKALRFAVGINLAF